MNAADRHELQRVKLRLLAGDRAGSLSAINALLAPASRALFLSPQMIFRFVTVHCEALQSEVPAHVCVARQVASDSQRTTDTERGQVSDYPSCVTERCAQGREVREALAERIAWRGAGPNGRFARARYRGTKGSEEHQHGAQDEETP